MLLVSHRALVAIPAAAIAVIVAVVTAFGLVMPWLFVAVCAFVAAAITAAVLLWQATPIALRRLGARRLPSQAAPRLESIVAGVCVGSGVVEPRLHVVETESIDAAVLGSEEQTHLVVTRGMLESLDRLELEAVVARELTQFGSGIRAATVLVGVLAMMGPLGGIVARRVVNRQDLSRADIEGVQFTRYPPGLVAAFGKALKVPRVADRPSGRHLWMIGPEGSTVQPPLVERVATLQEL